MLVEEVHSCTRINYFFPGVLIESLLDFSKLITFQSNLESDNTLTL